MQWKTIKSEVDYQNPYFKVTKDQCTHPDGKVVEAYYTITRPDVVNILGITQDQQAILIKQYRHPVKSTHIEVPAGYIEPQETPEQAARRELQEETGYTTKENLIPLGKAFASPGTNSNSVNFFLALNCQKTTHQNLDHSEDIEVILTPLAQLPNMLHQEIQDLAAITVSLLALKHLQK